MRYGGDIGVCFPIEIWYYQGDQGLGQPPFFRLLFFKRAGVGAYELYSPMADGPKSLIPQIAFYPTPDPFHEDKVAYQHLKEHVSPEVADAAWSSFPTSDGRKDLDFSSDRVSSSILVEKVRTFPYQKVKDTYAIEFLEHKAEVDVSYSVNHMNNFAQVEVLKDPSGLFFVNFSIEPEALSVDFFQDNYFTNIKNSVRVTDLNGKTIFQHEDVFPVELEEKQVENLKQRPFHLYDSFPLIPGQYKFYLLLENTVTKEFTSVEKDIFIPDREQFSMSSLILADRVDKNSPYSEVNKAFQVGNLQVYPSLRNRFSSQDKLFIFFQLYGAVDSLSKNTGLKFTIYDESEELLTIVKEWSDYSDKQNILEEFSLENIPAGKYGIRIAVLDTDGREVLFEEEGFSVYSQPFPEPWVVYKANPPSHDPEYSYVLGNQLLNKGDTKKALSELQKAYEAEPDVLDFALSYAGALLIHKRHREVEEILIPFVDFGEEDFQLYVLLGKSYQGDKKWEEAIVYFEKALASKGNVTQVLNSIGECHMNLGNRAKALHALEKSVEILPEQSKIKGMIQKIKMEKHR
jgi:tetratricopeptide (TPR) repeat protein